MSKPSIDTSELAAFVLKLTEARSGFRKYLANILRKMGEDFLAVVQTQIMMKGVMDSRLLLNSFQLGEQENVWELSEDGLTLEVGTNVKYAEYVNDGHWTCKQGETKRFVPGVWKGDRFIYQPGAKTGMVLYQKWIPGAHYWESAVDVFEKLLPSWAEDEMRIWAETHFGGGGA